MEPWKDCFGRERRVDVVRRVVASADVHITPGEAQALVRMGLRGSVQDDADARDGVWGWFRQLVRRHPDDHRDVLVWRLLRAVASLREALAEAREEVRTARTEADLLQYGPDDWEDA